MGDLVGALCTFVQDERIRKDNHGLEGVPRVALCAISANNVLNTVDCFEDSEACEAILIHPICL